MTSVLSGVRYADCGLWSEVGGGGGVGLFFLALHWAQHRPHYGVLLQGHDPGCEFGGVLGAEGVGEAGGHAGVFGVGAFFDA